MICIKCTKISTPIQPISIYFLVFFLFIFLLSSLPFISMAEDLSEGELLYQQAQAAETQREYTKAHQLFVKAIPLLLAEGKASLADDCDMRAQRASLYPIIYPYTLEELKEQIRKTYPQVSEEEIALWTAPEETEHAFYDGEDHYLDQALVNLAYRHVELMRANDKNMETLCNLVLKVNRVAENQPEDSFLQYDSPAVYRGTHTITIPRNELPAQGTYRLWLPIPINTGAQTNVIIESITPKEWVKQPPSLDQDIGLIYMEVPLAELTGDLSIQVVFTFSHSVQRFSIDPENVGEYDQSSALYQQYTRSYGNTEITPAIRTMAESIAAGENNPYLAARKLYDYIVNNITYALMPHNILWPRTELSESSYVHQYQRGDCGAQSMYFSAMCRALGIPARTTGGWQLFKDEFGGHFWAEFYLPNYGWVPVDTSVGQLALYPDNLSAEERQTFIDFYFANQDSMRCVVQKDTDLPLIPPASGEVFLPLAIQFPTAEYTIPTGELPLAFLTNSTMVCELISGQ